MKEINAINLKELRKHESFENISQMDESIYNYIEHIRHDVPRSVIDVLLCIGKASLRCVGISFMKQSTIAKDTGFTRKTVNKAIKRLESLGVVDSVRTQTKAGRPSVKIMRILPFSLVRLQQAVTSYETDEANNDEGLTLVETFEPIVPESLNSFNTLDKPVEQSANESSVDKIDDIDPDQLNDLIPDVVVESDFVKLAKPFFGTRKILSLSRVLRNALNKHSLTYYDPSIPEAIEKAFKATVFAYKYNRIKKTFASYFFGVLDTELSKVKRLLNPQGTLKLFAECMQEV
ncbi:helix-turn-helix domain-containing protein [Oceanobacillus longus]|uniref:Helix-turn-helix domain-containing protein n=1 Tax=Oceanobacillus longus TaxID=930120 RepID=A0ABV8GS55_9BACI